MKFDKLIVIGVKEIGEEEYPICTPAESVKLTFAVQALSILHQGSIFASLPTMKVVEFPFRVRL